MCILVVLKACTIQWGLTVKSLAIMVLQQVFFQIFKLPLCMQYMQILSIWKSGLMLLKMWALDIQQTGHFGSLQPGSWNCWTATDIVSPGRKVLDSFTNDSAVQIYNPFWNMFWSMKYNMCCTKYEQKQLYCDHYILFLLNWRAFSVTYVHIG